MDDKITSICWNITGECNENCKFCYRRICQDNTLEDNKKIFDNISQIPLEKISFCGGEPLLYEDLFSLIKYIKEKNPNIKLSMTTNGKCLDDELLTDILNYLDWISFSIDSTKPDINELMGRGYYHLDKVISLLEKCDKKIKVKINTVANKINKEEIGYIYNLISNYNINRWKLFRFFPIRNAIIHRDLFYLTDQESKEIEALSQKLNEKSSFNIEYNDFEGKPSCFSIQPNGSMENSDNDVIGNLLEDSIHKLLEIKKLELLNYHK